MIIDSWSAGVENHIKNYVYRLVDPRTGQTFYIGKGQSNRIFQHVKEAERLISPDDDGEDQISLKIQRIKEITAAGLHPIPIIHRHGLSEEVAFHVEAALIDAYDGLANIQTGHGSSSSGAMSVMEIEKTYGLPELDDCKDLSLVLININRVDQDRGYGRIYDQVRFCWRINMERAKNADYVLAVQRGVVIGAYAVDAWMEATPENFPEFNETVPGRWGFSGRKAEQPVWDRLVGVYGKRIVEDKMRHIQNPVRYWNL